MLRVVGIVALIVLAACAQTSAKTGPSPSPVIAPGNWNLNLTFSGDLAGQMTAIVPDTGTQQSSCSGSKTRSGEVWSDSFYSTLGANGDVWQLTIVINNFRGPGAYTEKDVHVAVQSLDNTKAWLDQQGDKVTFTIDRSQQSGTIDAQLTSAETGTQGAEHVTGTWNCRG
jgi:hypothetical protein